MINGFGTLGSIHQERSAFHPFISHILLQFIFSFSQSVGLLSHSKLEAVRASDICVSPIVTYVEVNLAGHMTPVSVVSEFPFCICSFTPLTLSLSNARNMPHGQRTRHCGTFLDVGNSAPLSSTPVFIRITLSCTDPGLRSRTDWKDLFKPRIIHVGTR